MTIACLKPDPKIENLADLETKVRAVYSAWADRGCKGPKRWAADPKQLEWPELKELTRSIVEDPGWRVYVSDRGKDWQCLSLVLLGPELFFWKRQGSDDVTCPMIGFLPTTLGGAITDATKMRHKRLPDASIDYTDQSTAEVRRHQNGILDRLKPVTGAT